jgi:protocatechuate 3,4-dioxygenase, beta subunit
MARPITPYLGRREMAFGLSAAAAALIVPLPNSMAQSSIVPTPRQSTGPFYPVDWTGDIDHDLVRVRGESAKAMGEVLHLKGRVLNVAGEPLSAATVEIWQCDAEGVYRHPRDEGAARRRDPGFQGRGRTRTDAQGRYGFRTIRPVPYGSRTPHIHFKVEPADRATLVTQMYVFGEPRNDRDGLLNSIRDPRQRDSVIVRLEPADRTEPGALAADFDIVIA